MSFALKIQKELRTDISSFYKESPQCVDQSTEKIKPIVEAIAEFFPPLGITPMPAALTALSAMRFGGISMKLEKEVPFDLDLDFLLTSRDQKFNVEGVRAILQQFSKHIYKKKGLVAQVCDGAPDIVGLKPGEESNGAWNFFVYVDHRSEITGENRVTSLITKYLPWFLATPVSGLSTMYHEHFDSIDAACDWTYNSLHKIPTQFTQLDFWVDFEQKVWPQVVAAPNLNSPPFLLAGVPFPNLMTHEMIAQQVNLVLCSPTGQIFGGKCQKDPNVCDFAMLGSVTHDENALSLVSQEYADSVLKGCSQSLHQKGFLSFEFCHVNGTALVPTQITPT